MELVPILQHGEKEVWCHTWLKAAGGILTVCLSRAVQNKISFHFSDTANTQHDSWPVIHILQVKIFNHMILISKEWNTTKVYLIRRHYYIFLKWEMPFKFFQKMLSVWFNCKAQTNIKHYFLCSFTFPVSLNTRDSVSSYC